MSDSQSQLPRKARVIAPMVAVAVLALSTPVWGQPTITDLGGLAGGNSVSFGTGVSSDGLAVTGAAELANGLRRAFRWTQAGGMQDLGLLPGRDQAYATAISGDGLTVVGLFDGGFEFFRWSGATGMQLLPGSGANSVAVSSDGSWAAGSIGNSAIRWTPASSTENLGSLPNADRAFALGISADGNAVIGGSNVFFQYPFPGRYQVRAFLWRSGAGMQNLGVLPGAAGSYATAISGDGLVVTGLSDYSAFLWTALSGMRDLGQPTDRWGHSPRLLSLNHDGSIGVGISDTNPNRAIFWTCSMGITHLNTFLASLGVDLAGWDLYDATGISADGTAIVGSAIHNGQYRAFLVRGLPCAPLLCAQPQPAIRGCLLGTVSLSVTAAGTGPFTYQWRKGGVPVDSSAGAAGNPSAATATLTLTNVGPSDVANYDCIVTNACGSVTSDAATLTICIGDADCDGDTDSDDIVTFFGAWDTGDLGGDSDGDGDTDSDDIIIFFNSWDSGC